MNKVPHAHPEPQETVHAATMKLETVAELLDAWTEKGGALDASRLLGPLHTLREAQTELLNVEWTRVSGDAQEEGGHRGGD